MNEPQQPLLPCPFYGTPPRTSNFGRQVYCATCVGLDITRERWQTRTPDSTPADAPKKPLLNLSKEWFANRADLEADHAVEAGAPTDAPGEAEYPLPEHAQRIKFEGCECVVMAPEDYEALYSKVATLRAECAGLREDANEARKALRIILGMDDDDGMTSERMEEIAKGPAASRGTEGK